MPPFYELANMLQNRQRILVIEGKMIDQEEGSMTEVIFLQCHVRFSLVRNATKHYGGRPRQHGLRGPNQQKNSRLHHPPPSPRVPGPSPPHSPPHTPPHTNTYTYT